ncbi:MAG: phenylalanine--tRNA ligase subunit alpha [Chloroflexi bacterium]|nr:phenylalanine--tRNA ligase subunit alpha [Chloroflexota bacterium]
MREELEKLKTKALAELEAIDGEEDLEEWRIAYLGRKGAITSFLRGLVSLPLEERRALGALANEMKSLLEKRFAETEKALKAAEAARLAEKGRIDVTLPGRPVPLGRLHPATQMIREICAAFTSMGFRVVEGPDVEWDYYSFEALNIPKGHPARDMWNTLWIDYQTEDGERPMLLRPHTSPMQIRVMEKTRPPVRVVVPGRCYRYEATDATHESAFFQVEGLAVDDGITFANMKGTLYEFARRIFGAERKARFRCDYFPFVEPGVEMAIDCFACGGKGCRICKESGWIEIMGAGMVHPGVLERVGYDSSIYTGFAFGLGVERMAMLKYGIEDIRLFYSNDMRFLRQF